MEYLKVTKRLREAVRRKRPDLWRGKNGCSILTMLRRFPPFRFEIFSQNMRRRSSHSPRTERTTNGVCRGDLRKFVGRDVHCSTRGIPGMLPKLEEMLGAMYKECRRKGTKPNFSKIRKQAVYLNCSESLRTDSEARCPKVFVVFFSPSST